MRSPKTILATALLAAAACGAAAPAAADGMLVPIWNYDIYETEQLAVLRHDAAIATESLYLLPRFRGDAADFAWIVPTPAEPEVATADVQLFFDLSSMAAAEYRHRDGAWDCNERIYTTGQVAGGVDVIDDSVVGIYRALTVAADDAAALTDSLTAWGYLSDGNQETVLPVLQSYVDRGWYFVLMRIASPEDHAAGDPWYGMLEPIRLTFDAAEPVYPLAISAPSAPPESRVVIYTIADHRLTFPGAQTTYANRITAGELSELRDTHATAGGVLRAGDFVTRLQRVYAPEEMDADLTLARAPNDDELRLIYYSGWPFTTALLLGTALWLRWRPRRRRT